MGALDVTEVCFQMHECCQRTEGPSFLQFHPSSAKNLSPSLQSDVYGSKSKLFWEVPVVVLDLFHPSEMITILFNNLRLRLFAVQH